MQEAEIVETGRQLAQLEQESQELLSIIEPHARGQAACAQILNTTLQQQAAPNATVIPVAPGHKIHSNSVSQPEMVSTIMQSPEILKLGLTSEALGIVAAAMTDNMLRQFQAKSMTVADPSQALALVPDLQTVNMEAEAERKRKVEVDNESTDESSDEEERKEADALNSREEGKPKSAKNRVNRLTKNERKANGKGAAKGSASVQKENQK
jgi:hypothetical protein